MSPADRIWDVVGIGANAVDYVYLLPAFPQPFDRSVKIHVKHEAILCGGQTATAMATCASLGLRAKYVGATGTDQNGDRIRQELATRGIDVADVIVRDGMNQYAVILLERDTAERIVLWDRDERLRLRTDDLPLDAIAAARVVHVDDVDEGAAIEAARLARERGAIVTSDLDGMSDRSDELFAAVTVPMFAEQAPAALSGVSDPEQALRKLRKRHDGLLCVTLGDRGAMALEGDQCHYSPGFKVDARDTTGAGDVFRGGFIYGLLQGWPIVEVLRFANAAAAVSCTRVGALNGVPTHHEIQQLRDGAGRSQS